MVTIETANDVLKSYYLDAVTEALNTKANPFLARIKKSTSDVYGKEVRKLMKYGVNGGISAGTETGDLPKSCNLLDVQFVSTLKNLYGQIEISDKALRASKHSDGAFVDLLNDQMQSLINSATFNFGRMLFGDGTGLLATIKEIDDNDRVVVDDMSGIFEGMIIDIYQEDGTIAEGGYHANVSVVDREAKLLYIDGPGVDPSLLSGGMKIYLQGSKDCEMSGLKAIFGDTQKIYGVYRNFSSALYPYKKTDVGEISESVIQTAIDKIEENCGSKVNFIICSWGVKRALSKYYRQFNVMLQTKEFDGGFTATSFNGIPVVADRFCPEGTMYLLNTDDFKIHQLCDWQWLEGEDGKVLKQIPGKPVFTATLVKYAELMCDRPCGQGMLSGITEE